MFSSLKKLKDTAYEKLGLRSEIDKDITQFKNDLKICENNLDALDSCLNDELSYIRNYKQHLTKTLKCFPTIEACNDPKDVWKHTCYFTNSLTIIDNSNDDITESHLIYNLLSNIEEEFILINDMNERILQCENTIEEYDMANEDIDWDVNNGSLYPSLKINESLNINDINKNQSLNTNNSIEDENILPQIKINDETMLNIEEEDQRLYFIISQQKLQLQRDINDLKKHNHQFVLDSIQKIKLIKSKMYLNFSKTLLSKPPSSLLNSYEPLLKDKSDAEMEFTIKAGKNYILPLDVVPDRLVRWSFYCDQDIGFGVTWKYINKHIQTDNQKQTEESENEISDQSETENQQNKPISSVSENITLNNINNENTIEEECELLNESPSKLLETSKSSSQSISTPQENAVIDINSNTSIKLESNNDETNKNISNVTMQPNTNIHTTINKDNNKAIDSSKDDTSTTTTILTSNTIIIVQPKQPCGGDGRHVIGSFTSPSTGMLIFDWDNTYSIFTSKTVYLRLAYTDQK